MPQRIFRYWTHWDNWLPSYAQMSVKGYRLQAVHGVRQGFPYVGLLYIPTGSRRGTWKLLPDMYGVTLWHRLVPNGRYHRHSTIGWRHRPALTWASRMRAGIECPLISSAS